MLDRILVVMLAMFLCLVPALASEGPPPKLEPRTYRSLSGEYSLFVNPSDQYGVGPATYTLSRGGQSLWEKQLPYSLWEAVIGDDGVIAGYAYSHGFQGWGAGSGTYGELIVAVVGPDGVERAAERTVRRADFLSCPPNRQPSPRGCFLQPDLKRFVVRVDEDPKNFIGRNESWWTYTLDDGHRNGSVTLASPASGERLWYTAVDADSVPGTDLSLVLWNRTKWGEGKDREEGFRLALVDAQAREVWSSERARELDPEKPYFRWTVKEHDLTPRERFSNGSFVFRSPAKQAAITYRARKSAGGVWAVDEVSSVPEPVGLDDVPEQGTVHEEIAADGVPLPLVGTIALTAGEAVEELGISEFEFDDRGRCGYLHFTKDRAFELVLLDPAKPDPIAAAQRIKLEGLGRDDQLMTPSVAWVGGDRWVVVQGSYDKTAPTRGWVTDIATGKLSPIDPFDAPKPRMGRLAPGGALGFAVVGDWQTQQITRFDANAAKLWSVEPDGTPQDAALQPNGTLGVLVGISNQIEEYDAHGTKVRTIDLAKVFGAKPNYVTGLNADKGGGWIVEDFDGEPPIRRVSADLHVRAAFKPRHADGRLFRIRGSVQRAPDGRLWTSDSAALLRLDDQGVVDRVIGPTPGTDAVLDLRAVSIGTNGAIYALDGRAGTVHVFDPKGQRQRLLRPAPTDAPVDLGGGSMTVAGDGSVYSRPNADHNDRRYVKFAKDGTNAGLQPSRCDEVSEEWFFRPGGQELLVLGYERAFLYDAAGKLVQTVERRADRLWLEYPDHAAVAPDGSFAILAGGRGRSGPKPSVTLYSPKGDPVSTVELPFRSLLARVAASDSHVCVAQGNHALLVDRRTGKAVVHTLPSGDDRSWHQPFFSPDGSELWLVDFEKKLIERYKVPAV